MNKQAAFDQMLENLSIRRTWVIATSGYKDRFLVSDTVITSSMLGGHFQWTREEEAADAIMAIADVSGVKADYVTVCKAIRDVKPINLGSYRAGDSYVSGPIDIQAVQAVLDAHKPGLRPEYLALAVEKAALAGEREKCFIRHHLAECNRINALHHATQDNQVNFCLNDHPRYGGASKLNRQRNSDMTNFDLIFDNGGGITLQTENFCHYYSGTEEQTATDVADLLDGSDPRYWDGNYPEYRTMYDASMELNGSYHWVTDNDVMEAIGQLPEEDREAFLDSISGRAERQFFECLFAISDDRALQQ